ncbi:MAG: hypothetical protein CMJ31_10945 [Phycisphaerae bacterium]|nr:hypothetical protein [Phycisphaerae bacterium]
MRGPSDSKNAARNEGLRVGFQMRDGIARMARVKEARESGRVDGEWVGGAGRVRLSREGRGRGAG